MLRRIREEVNTPPRSIWATAEPGAPVALVNASRVGNRI